MDNKKQIKKECRFYEKEMPNEGDHVIIAVSDVTDYSIVVQLLEYDKMEGMITLAEYSKSSRSRQYNRGILEARKMKNKKDVCQVLRTDNENQNVDLTRRKINAEASNEIQENFVKSKKVQSLFYPLCDEFQKDMIYFYEQIVFPLQRQSDEHIYNIFQQAIFDFDDIIDPLKLDDKLRESFQRELKKQFTPKSEKIKAIFEITCISKEGVEDIKRALKEGEKVSDKEITLKISLIGSPKFEISTNCINLKLGKERIQKALQQIQQYIQKVGGTFEIKQSPSSKDGRELALASLINDEKKNYSKPLVEDNEEGIDIDIEDNQQIQFSYYLFNKIFFNLKTIVNIICFLKFKRQTKQKVNKINYMLYFFWEQHLLL